jgi:hypothetical protein
MEGNDGLLTTIGKVVKARGEAKKTEQEEEEREALLSAGIPGVSWRSGDPATLIQIGPGSLQYIVIALLEDLRKDVGVQQGGQHRSFPPDKEMTAI